jgi:peptide/nickel transport system ATP-binding protein
MATPLLTVENLDVRFPSMQEAVRCVEALSFQLEPGGTLGIVGESGSGKSVSSLALLGLLQGAEVRGRALFQGEDLLTMAPRRLRQLRGRRISMIFQDPMTSLNPGHTIGEQLMEGLQLHLGLTRAEARTQAVDWLAQVGIPAPVARFRQYPYELSGGLRQRVLIAMALCCGPDLLIADEPTTALDVTVQAQILDLIQAIQRQRGMALILITHDLAVVARTCARIRVMYAGRAVEEGPTQSLLREPRHPYTAGLIRSAAFGARPRERLQEIPGQVPDLRHPPAGCRFHDRCPLATGLCLAKEPSLGGKEDRLWRCHFPLGAP